MINTFDIHFSSIPQKKRGSIESQVWFFTNRVQKLSRHLGTHKKDYSSQRSLRKLLIKRKRLLLYLYNKKKLGSKPN
uniref:Small ribosomal subunit protein uS15c n=1 Tax=Ephedra somalensis TaxID=288821 RepID=A0A8F4TIC1_9SPER|nr:ribosomal protein S15 [Ephedra somalensis]QXG18331.1 ribosomal protein S15 [Ephedra somalensis]